MPLNHRCLSQPCVSILQLRDKGFYDQPGGNFGRQIFLFKIDITWKKIVFGYIEDIMPHKIRNLLFSVILYGLFKNWMSSFDDQTKYVCAYILNIKTQTFWFRHSVLMCKDRLTYSWEKVINHIMQI